MGVSDMTLQRYCMQYNGFDECVDEEAYDGGEWVKAFEALDIIEVQKEQIAKRDAEIASLKKMNDRLQDNILKESCPWCGLNNKSNVKKLALESTTSQEGS